MCQPTAPARISNEDETLPASLTAQLLLRRTGNWTRWLHRHWSEISILHAVCSEEPVAGRPRLHAQVCVTLGHFTPADVRVELIPAEPLPPDHPLFDGRSMFGVSVDDNGRRWFAVNTRAASGDAERDWMVRISPSRPVRGVEIHPVTRLLERVPAGTRRREIRRSPAA